MRPLRSILVLADFSPKSDNAVARAALLAREHGTSLRLLHVVAPRKLVAASVWIREHGDLPLRIERARRALATLAARMAKRHGVRAAAEVRAGDTLQVILEESSAIDLVVVAAKRRNALRDFVLRTPTERLLRIVQRPMLIVKRAAAAGYTEGFGGGDELAVVPKDGPAGMATFLLGTPAQRLVAHASCDVLVLPRGA